MPVFSVDDILFFLAEMKNNGLKNTQRGMAKYKKTQQYYAFNYKPIKISKNDQTKVDYLNTSHQSTTSLKNFKSMMNILI